MGEREEREGQRTSGCTEFNDTDTHEGQGHAQLTEASTPLPLNPNASPNNLRASLEVPQETARSNHSEQLSICLASWQSPASRHKWSVRKHAA